MHFFSQCLYFSFGTSLKFLGALAVVVAIFPIIVRVNQDARRPVSECKCMLFLFRTFTGYKLHTSDGDVFPIKEAKAAASNLNLAQCARTRRKGNKVWKIGKSVEV